tara:strand:- start:1252 stop:1788 length:537 start_codon:yes stop_codon:yes gene_type:complete
MKYKETLIKDLIIFEPEVFKDTRGFFMESYNKEKFNNAIQKDISFVQDNFSLSRHGVLRGIHYQNKPYEQAKLVRVTKGKIFDVAVDLRKGSSTYLSWFGIELSDKNHKMLFIPEGFGHAFLTLSDVAHLNYKTNNYFNKDADACIRWDDPNISINWPFELIDCDAIISDKDKEGILL